MPDSNDLAIYIHFPYCRSRCPYCDFFRALKPRGYDEQVYREKIIADAEYFAALLGNRPVKSVFFGGGTPSLLSPESIGQILDTLAQHFSLKPTVEISLEANPNTYEQEKFTAFRAAGINRLSLGVQALTAEGLKFLGRTHTLDDAVRAAAAAVSLFNKSSIDLIYARPKQQWETWQQEIDTALSFGFKHLSFYELSIEENTPFKRKNIQPLEEEKAAALYKQTVNYLRLKGYNRYEVSNFSAADKDKCVHNLVYWQGGDYIGLGEGAHGRFKNNNGQIYASVDGKITENITPQERAEELLIMGLRLESGIDAGKFLENCGIPLFSFLNSSALNNLAKLKLLCYDEKNLRLTDEGFLFLDKIIADLAG